MKRKRNESKGLKSQKHFYEATKKAVEMENDTYAKNHAVCVCVCVSFIL